MKNLFKLKVKRPWTPAEVAFLMNNANTMKDEDIALRLTRSLKSVREKRGRLEITKGHGRGHIGVTKQFGRNTTNDENITDPTPPSNGV